MSLLAWLGLFFLAFNLLFVAIILIGYIRAQWKEVDKEMKDEKAAQDAFKKRIMDVDWMLDDVLKNKESLL